MKKFPYTLLALAVASASMATDFDDVFSDDVFGADPFADIDTSDIEISDSPWSINHELSLQTIINLNSEKTNAVEKLYSGVTSLTTEYKPAVSVEVSEDFSLRGEVAVKVDSIFWLREEDAWSDEDIDARQYSVDIKELVAQYRLSSWQLSTGYQIVTLGLADALSVANVLYAQNLAVPGTTDIDDTIKPAWTSMVSGSIGPVRIKAGSVHTHEISDLPVAGTDFDISAQGPGLRTMLNAANLSIEAEDLALENMGWFASLSGVVGALDWQFNATSQLSHTPTPVLVMTGMGPFPNSLHYPRLNNTSLGLSYVTGPVLWKLEGAFTDGYQAQDARLKLQDYQRAAGTFGLDYDSSFGRVVAEIQYGAILDYNNLNLLPSEISPEEESLQWALMYSQSFRREALTVTGQVLSIDLDSSGGRMQSLALEYDFSDQLSGSVKVVDYIAGDYQFLNGADDRDRLLTNIRYSF